PYFTVITLGSHFARRNQSTQWQAAKSRVVLRLRSAGLRLMKIRRVGRNASGRAFIDHLVAAIQSSVPFPNKPNLHRIVPLPEACYLVCAALVRLQDRAPQPFEIQ